MTRITTAAAVTTLALAGVAMAQQPTGFAAGLNYFPDNLGISTTTVTQNNYPSVLQISESLPSGVVLGTSRHVGTFTSGPNTPFVVQNLQPWSYQVTVRMSGNSSREIGLHIGSLGAFPPGNAGAITGQLMVNANGEIAAFGAWLPFFSNNQPQYASLPRGARDQDFTLGFSVVPTASSVAVTYSVNGANIGPFELDPGAFSFYNGLANTAGTYVQNSGAGSSTGTFTNWSYVPTPGSAAVLALGGLVAARRRRA